MSLDPWADRYESERIKRLKEAAERDGIIPKPNKWLDALAWVFIWGMGLGLIGLGITMLVIDKTVGGLLGIFLVVFGLWWLFEFFESS